MSLFPAYAGEINRKAEEQEKASQEQHTWLQNSSFQVNINKTVPLLEQQQQQEENEPKTINIDDLTSFIPEDETDNDDDKEVDVEIKKKRKYERSKHKSKKAKLDPTADLLKHGYIVDRKKIKEFLNIKTITRPSAPKYTISYYAKNKQLYGRRKRRFRRYFNKIHKEDDDKSNSETEEIITKANLNKMDVHNNRNNENFVGFKQEEELSKTTATYNRKLTENPHDIKLWLDYVNFQEIIHKFEKTYRKGSIAKAVRVLGERKLSILDRALQHNNNNNELLRERLNIAVSIYPSDELQIQLKHFVDKEQNNIILWQGYIESVQCSMSHCNTPSVLNLYTKCLSILHKLRRNSKMETQQLEENILKILYQCGLFLKQAGLNEQLWTLLRLYLELNLSPIDKNKFNINSNFNEQQLIDLEEIILNSQLPLHELWLRIEKLRESCHWFPYTGDENHCEDPQRLVFPDDVNELIHPITIQENIFKMIVIILNLLKIPILPFRHCTIQDLGLDYVPWSLDSIEPLLSIYLPLYSINLFNNNLMIDNRLASGAQYLNVLPGQEEYLDFILTTMKNCFDCLSGGSNDRLAVTLWWMKFQRILIILNKQERYKIPKNYVKKIKANVKNLLKQEENRNNILYYCEYALIELELDNKDNCLNILKTTLNFVKTMKITTNFFSDNQISTCHLYRTLIEALLIDFNGDNDGKQSILRYLCSYVLEKKDVIPTITDEILQQVGLKFKHVTLQLLDRDVDKLPVVKQFLPDFFTDWIILNGWFIYLNQNYKECGKFVENTLKLLDDKYPEVLWQKELLYEFYTVVYYKTTIINPNYEIFKILNNILVESIEKYPNNLFLLNMLAKQQTIVNSSGGYPWWKLKSLLLNSGRSFTILFLILIVNQQINEYKNTIIQTYNGVTCDINDNMKNRMLSLFRYITKNDMCTRRCGLIWRLYLQFVHAYFDPILCRNIYYRAVEECPWLKALYIDAAIYIPAELGQIQDLIIEKQLRLHVTPEELDVLRN